jgi:hypothetical protein
MDEQTIANMATHCRRLLPEIEGVRHWALDEQGWESLATIAAAWLEQRLEHGERFSDDSFKQFLSEIADAVPSLRQQKNGAAPEIPEAWIHPIFKTPLGLPKTVDERGVLAERDGRLLKLLEELEERPYATVARLQDEAERHARLSAIKVGEAEARTNPYLTRDMQAITVLVKQDAERAAAFKREAEMTPVRLPWQIGDKNLTEIGQLVKKSPQLAKLANRAAELQRQKIAERRSEAQRARAEADAKLRETEKLLAATA